MDKVAVVILNWNGLAMLRRMLPSVVEWSCGARVWVADNASTDGSVSWLREYFPCVGLLELDCNYGFAGGYNRALSLIDAEYYVLLNSDVEVRGDWLSPLLSFMEDHPCVAACQPKLLSFDKPDCFEYAGAAGGFIDGLGYPYCRGRLFGSLECDRGQYDVPIGVDWTSGAAMMVRSAVWRELGGLDERFFAHMEEIDFCLRVRSRGYDLFCVPSGVVWHVGGGTLSKGNPRKTYLNFRNNLILLYKNLSDERLVGVLRARYWLDRLAALMFLVKGEFGSFCAVFRARRDFKRLRGELVEVRSDVLSKSVRGGFRLDCVGSVLWAYYVFGHRRWSEIHDK